MKTIQIIRLSPIWKYELVQAAVYNIPIALRLTVPKPITQDYFSIWPDMISAKTGSRFDGPSGPAIDTTNFMRASLFHDIGCQAINHGLLPKTDQVKIDKIMYAICREDGMSWLRAQLAYKAVRAYQKTKGK